MSPQMSKTGHTAVNPEGFSEEVHMEERAEASSSDATASELREYHSVDKSAWGDGTWQDEPDKRQWRDAKTGLPCLIVRGPSGALCGYVGVSTSHHFHGKSYDDLEVVAHGGLTYAGGCRHGSDPSTGICHIPAPGEPDDVWWFGFDCAHAGDFCPKYEDVKELGRPTGWGDVITYRDFAYVTSEVGELARQLAALSDGPKGQDETANDTPGMNP